MQLGEFLAEHLVAMPLHLVLGAKCICVPDVMVALVM
jgi:hypothetical protein